MKKFVVFLMIVVFFIQFVGCAGMNINPADLKTPHARGRFVNAIYIAAYNDHVRYANLENLRPEAKELLNAKRNILIELADPLYGPIPIFNTYIETGEIITDSMFNGLLDRLLLLQMGWYTDPKAYSADGPTPQVFRLVPAKDNTEDQLKTALKNASAQASIISDKPTAQIDPIVIGTLIELLRIGIHAIQTMLQQRNLDETQMAEAYQESLAQFKLLDPTTLKVLE